MIDNDVEEQIIFNSEVDLIYPVPVPYDHIELEKITKLIEKIPEYQNKLYQLEKDIKQFALTASKSTTFTCSYEIEKIIFRAFFIELEKRPFQAPTTEQLQRLKANIVHEDIIEKRNIPCEICGENRSVDRCHIIPKRLGGSASSHNIIILCPTHHRLFDRYMLSRAEFCSIDWERKSLAAQEYVMSITLQSHRTFWNDAQEKKRFLMEYEKQSLSPFIRYIINQVLELFVDNRILKHSQILKILDPDILYLAKPIIKELVLNGFLLQEKRGSNKFLSKPNISLEIDDRIIKKIFNTLPI